MKVYILEWSAHSDWEHWITEQQILGVYPTQVAAEKALADKLPLYETGCEDPRLDITEWDMDSQTTAHVHGVSYHEDFIRRQSCGGPYSAEEERYLKEAKYEGLIDMDDWQARDKIVSAGSRFGPSVIPEGIL